MDDRIKKNPKNELLEDIRKIVKEETEKSIFPTNPLRPWGQPFYWNPCHPYWDSVTYSLRITGHSSF